MNHSEDMNIAEPESNVQGGDTSFGINELRGALREGANRREWALRQGFGVAGDSAPPPIPLGIEKADPAGARAAIEQALTIQRDDPPPSGKVWHITESDREGLIKLGGDKIAHLLDSLDDEGVSDRDELGAVAHVVLPLAAALSVLVVALLAFWLL